MDTFQSVKASASKRGTGQREDPTALVFWKLIRIRTQQRSPEAGLQSPLGSVINAGISSAAVNRKGAAINQQPRQ